MVKKAIVTLGLIKNLFSATERSIGVILGDTVRLHLDYLVHFWSLIFKKKSKSHRRPTAMTRRMENFTRK